MAQDENKRSSNADAKGDEIEVKDLSAKKVDESAEQQVKGGAGVSFQEFHITKPHDTSSSK